MFLALSLATVGSLKAYGALFALSVACALPVLGRLPLKRLLAMPAALRLFGIGAVALNILVLLHLIAGHADGGDFESYLRVLLGFIAAAVALALMDFDGARLLRFVGWSCLAQVTLATVVAIWQTVELGQGIEAGIRAHGGTNAIAFSEISIAAGGLASLILLRADAALPRWRGFALSGAALALTVAVAHLSGTRGTMPALVLLVLLLALTIRREVSLRAALAMLMLPVLLVAGSYAFDRRVGEAVADADAILAAPAGEAEVSGSTSDRLALWRAAVVLIGQSPLLGHGMQAMDAGSSVWPPPGPDSAHLGSYNQMHNVYLDVLVKAGLVGLIPTLALFLAPLWAGVSALRGEAALQAALGTIWIGAAYASFGLTQVFFSHANSSLQFGLLAALMMQAARSTPAHPGGETR